jgi:RNA polymerase sigma-70 factor (ECF subfamily)
MILLTNYISPVKKFFSLLLNILAFLRNISPASDTDADLVARYQQTENLAVLGTLYSRYMDLIYGICLKYLKNSDDAQDAVMGIFEELVAKLKKHEVQHFKSWLYTVAKNHCLMKLRQDKKVPLTKIQEEFMQSEENGHLEEVLTREENFRQLESCLEQLTPDQRRVIEMFYLQRKCYNDISAETSIEWKAVRSFIQNGRRNLKICIEAQKEKSITHE